MLVRRPDSSRYVDTTPDDRIGIQYDFYMPKGYTKSNIVKNKLKGAEKIFVWDPSFNEKDKAFYNSITSERIEVEILTICDKDQFRKEIETYFDLIKETLLDKGVDFRLTVYAFFNKDTKECKDLELWHDRYLIVEKNNTQEVYLVGTSVSSHLNGHKAFGVCRLKEEKDKAIVTKAYEEFRKKINDHTGVKLSFSEPSDF